MSRRVCFGMEFNLCFRDTFCLMCFLFSLSMQDILLMKGEGEVKLNMTVGKGEQVLKHNRLEGQEAICSQLQSLKDAWANMLMTSMSCHR